MPCEYESMSVFMEFKDRVTLEKALTRMKNNRDAFQVRGLSVMADRNDLNQLKQAYQTEAARAALKAKGFFVAEQRAENGKITLTVRA